MMNKPFNLAPGASPASPVGLAPTSRTAFARVPGEAFDSDQVTQPCDCGCDYHGSECAYGYPPSTKSRDEIDADHRVALDRIARVMLGVRS